MTEEKENKKKIKEQKENLGNKHKKNRTRLKPRETNHETVCVVCLKNNEEDWIQYSKKGKYSKGEVRRCLAPGIAAHTSHRTTPKDLRQ